MKKPAGEDSLPTNSPGAPDQDQEYSARGLRGFIAIASASQRRRIHQRQVTLHDRPQTGCSPLTAKRLEAFSISRGQWRNGIHASYNDAANSRRGFIALQERAENDDA